VSAEGLRVALLSPCDWPEVRRGTERFAHELAAALLADGAHPRLITSHRGFPRLTREDGLDVLRLWRPPGGRLERRRFEQHLTHVPLSYAALRLGGDDLAHALYATDALAAARWSSRTGRPSVFSFMGIPNHVWLGERRRRPEILRAAAHGCDATVAVSRAAAVALEHWLGIEARVIPPGVDLHAFAPAERRSPHPTIFCAAAVGEPRKGIGLLLEAFSLLRRRRSDVRLELSRPQMAADTAAWEPLPSGVVWRAVDDPVELARANAESWTAVLPSQHEAFGLVLLEALACGTPVVGMRDGGVPELVDTETVGRLVEDQRSDELAAALDQALELSRAPATAQRCRAVAERFGWAGAAQAYQRLYRELGAG